MYVRAHIVFNIDKSLINFSISDKIYHSFVYSHTKYMYMVHS